MATPSIYLKPSGYESGTVFSVLPTDGTADLAFARTSIANRINSSKIIEEMATGVPRLDYLDGTCPSLLLEPQSTNLITYPLSFDNAYWTKSGATVTGGQSAPSVDNPTSAFKLVESASTGVHYMFTSTITVSNGSTNYNSIYIKPNGVNWVYLYDGASNDAAYFDLENKVIGSTSGSPLNYIIEEVSDGWLRIGFSSEAPSTSVQLRLYLASANNVISYTGNGTSGVYIFGAQLEQQSYATSLMLPATEGSTVTRVAETASKAGLASYINSEEGVLYAELNYKVQHSISRYIGVSNGTTSNRVIFGVAANSNALTCFISASTNTQLSYSLPSIDAVYKIALKYKENDFALWVNGIEVDTDNSGTTPLSGVLNSICANGSLTTQGFFGKVNDLRIYKTALTDAELTTLTT